jgi:hypothetical protein
MYSVKNLINKNPIQISGAVLAIMNWLVLMDWVELADKQVAGFNTALVAVLGVFIANKTENSESLRELEADSQGETWTPPSRS